MPLIILGLVAPSIVDIGASARKLLVIIALIAYGSTIFAGYLSYTSQCIALKLPAMSRVTVLSLWS